MAEDWWSLKKASEQTGLTSEAIRRWALGDPPRVETRLIAYGRKQRREVLARDVVREAVASGRPGPHVKPPSAIAGFESEDRLITLEEVARRYRLIDSLRGEIEQRHLEIDAHHRDIEMMLQGTARVPNN